MALIEQTDYCITGRDNVNGGKVTVEPCYNDPIEDVIERWNATGGARVGSGRGTTTLLKIHGNKCLDVAGGQDVSGTKLQIWDCSAGNPNQQWQVNADTTVKWVGHNKCVDLTGGNKNIGNQASAGRMDEKK